ncbi:hypothetical protein I4U23_007382 [Adineta vaga]|nr:hypothetical protein I4U23_007382 [Adineta vaga]
MPRLGCDTHIEKPLTNIVDRVYDLKNRVQWLKNVEFCLLGDQTDRLTKIKSERHDMETFNNDLRKTLRKSGEKEGIEYVKNKQDRLMQQHDQLLFLQQCLLHRLEFLQDEIRSTQRTNQSISLPTKLFHNTEMLTSRIREIQDRLTSVNLINKTLNTCKQHLQCDLDLLRKELPNMQKDIGQKFDQRIILKKEFTDIVAENKRRLKIYQQLLVQTEVQSRQRRIIHEQAMASIAEQLENQYQVQMTVMNDMATVFDSRRLTSTGGPSANIEKQNSTLMKSDEIVQIRCMYDQFYNIIMAGLPIDISTVKEPPIDFIERLQYIFDIISNTIKTMTLETTDDDDDHQTSPIVLRNVGDESSRKYFDY